MDWCWSSESTGSTLTNWPTPGPAARPTTASSPEHPRVGGEGAPSMCEAVARFGTPPRRRGGHSRSGHGPPARNTPRRREGRPARRRVRSGRRNTPASAGRTRGGPSRTGRISDHPRVGWEDRAEAVLPLEVREAPRVAGEDRPACSPACASGWNPETSVTSCDGPSISTASWTARLSTPCWTWHCPPPPRSRGLGDLSTHPPG